MRFCGRKKLQRSVMAEKGKLVDLRRIWSNRVYFFFLLIDLIEQSSVFHFFLFIDSTKQLCVSDFFLWGSATQTNSKREWIQHINQPIINDNDDDDNIDKVVFSSYK